MTRHNIQRNWKAEQLRHKEWTALKKIQSIEVPVDRGFWQLWKADKEAMKEAGYSVKKIDGIWRAFIAR